MSSKHTATEALLHFLEDEFSGFPEVRVQLRKKAGVIKSQDLEQNYDPSAHTLHTAEGVMVRARSRDYFFPSNWFTGRDRAKLDAQVREIHEFIES
jgi:hypothetical protein